MEMAHLLIAFTALVVLLHTCGACLHGSTSFQGKGCSSGSGCGVGAGSVRGMITVASACCSNCFCISSSGTLNEPPRPQSSVQELSANHRPVVASYSRKSHS